MDLWGNPGYVTCDELELKPYVSLRQAIFNDGPWL